MTRTDAAPMILYTSADASPQSGAFRCLLDMGIEIQNWGFRSVLVLPQKPADSASPADSLLTYVVPLPRPRRGLSIVQYAADLLETVRSASRLVRIIRREHVAVVHINEILDIYAGIAARVARVPVVWHIRADMSSWPSPLQALLPRVVGALAAQIVVVSASVRDEVFRRHGVATSKVRVIHDPGPDPSEFHPDVDGSGVRRGLAVPPDASLIVLVSKLVEPKGHEVLLRAAPRVLGSFPNARFAIVGGDVDGAHHRRYADRLRRLPQELGIGSAVTFTGFRSDIPQIMAAADVVVHCATHPDPFPGVVLQGMAVGKPVVASDIGGSREQITDGVTGVLVPMADAGALSEAICSLLADPEKRASLGRSAANHVRSTFTSERFHRELSDVYARVMSR
jgi:glycosyltransferase involved in cell wall biosynthesis